MSKRVKISLISSAILYVIVVLLSLIFPVMSFYNRKIDIFVVTFISCLVFYVFTYLLIRGLEKRDEKRNKQ
jgi:uncharacterized membrane protein